MGENIEDVFRDLLDGVATVRELRNYCIDACSRVPAELEFKAFAFLQAYVASAAFLNCGGAFSLGCACTLCDTTTGLASSDCDWLRSEVLPFRCNPDVNVYGVASFPNGTRFLLFGVLGGDLRVYFPRSSYCSPSLAVLGDLCPFEPITEAELRTNYHGVPPCGCWLS